jgi:hypothetical protein
MGVVTAYPMMVLVEHRKIGPEQFRYSLVPNPTVLRRATPVQKLSEGPVELVFDPDALGAYKRYAILRLTVWGPYKWPDLGIARQAATNRFGESPQLDAVFDYMATLEPFGLARGKQFQVPSAFEAISDFYALMLQLREVAAASAGIVFSRGRTIEAYRAGWIAAPTPPSLVLLRDAHLAAIAALPR